MSYHLIVDQGNTTCKVALVRDHAIENISLLSSTAGEALEQLIGGQQFDGAIYASVGQRDAVAETVVMRSATNVVFMGQDTPVPIRVAYDRRTLGADRLAAAVGAHSLYPNCELLVIDAGTAITYEHIAADGTYLGGNIAPGIQLRFKALHHFTGRLPLVEQPSLSQEIPLYGGTTEEAIVAGVIRGLAHEIDGYISTLHAKTEQARVIMTGGNANYLAQILQSRTLIHTDLVLLGLNRILEHNV
ncbi:type III pantothenate kinase [Porphyromonas loveana]|uniref:Type III pantothenate kinase n=1 Tax=Porphyromonas loveana TaxID=1884669 RepID=A0A2U1F7C3_9PORP|nr:type III pantothenate kinase [Porphyromonas loveana]PVZ08076.1 type III pantothenate kinase [Porphyromonas loveana]